MERPPKKYVCEKCGYLGDTSEHEGCDYLAWTTGEQLCIDQLERELALLKASPASAPAVCSPTLTECPRCHNDVKKCDGVFAAPTPPVSEDRNKLELYKELIYAVASKFPGESRHQTALRYIRNAEKGSDNATTQEDKS